MRDAPLWSALVAALVGAATSAGCGLGPGSSSRGAAELTVTRDYGRTPVAHATESDPRESETVIRFLDRETEVTTRYGGGFVQSIAGISGASSGGRRFDWFFYVNGIESSVGAVDVRVRGGDRIWWDYRDWTSAMRVPAVVGSFPEPFLQASTPSDRRTPVRIECAGRRAPCRIAADRLAEAGVDAGIERFGRGSGGSGTALRLLVGPWGAIRRDSATSLDGPADTGVFANFRPGGHGRFELVLADPRADPRCGFRAGAGLVAALGGRDDMPVWLVTGTDQAGVRRAADALDVQDLRNRYAVAVPSRGPSLNAPVVAGGPPECSGEAGA